MMTTYLKMLTSSLECDDTMWWRIDNFLWFFPSLHLELFMNTYYTPFSLILLLCHLSALWSFDTLLDLPLHSFLRLQQISRQHIPEGIYNFETSVVCLEFCCVPSMLMKRWYWGYFSMDFVYHVLIQAWLKVEDNLQQKTEWMNFGTYSFYIYVEWGM
jgi:hypothetical protein